MTIKIDYELKDDGGATVVISDGRIKHENRVSHLHDSLLDLANMALSIQRGAKAIEAVFVVDPEEIHFTVSIEDGMAFFELREFKDWASLNQNQQSKYKALLEGYTSPDDIIQQIVEILPTIYDKFGP